MGRAAAPPGGAFEPGRFLRFSSAALPERDRMSIWREHFGRKVMNVEIEPFSGSMFAHDSVSLLMPQAVIGRYSASNVRIRRTSSLLSDGATDVNFMFIKAGRGMKTSAYGEETASSGSALLGWQAQAREFVTSADLRTDTVILNYDRLSRMLRGRDECFVRPLKKNNSALALLGAYVEALNSTVEGIDAALMPRIVDHFYDLAAVALGAGADYAEHVREDGTRQARFAAMKADIQRHLDSHEISSSWLALRHGISPSYVRRIFEAEGLSVSKFVLNERLEKARRMLAQGLSSRRTISSLAYRAGFSDLSYFNRAFKQRFGMTPSEAASAAE